MLLHNDHGAVWVAQLQIGIIKKNVFKGEHMTREQLPICLPGFTVKQHESSH